MGEAFEMDSEETGGSEQTGEAWERALATTLVCLPPLPLPFVLRPDPGCHRGSRYGQGTPRYSPHMAYLSRSMAIAACIGWWRFLYADICPHTVSTVSQRERELGVSLFD